jgi:hypothetical protein
VCARFVPQAASAAASDQVARDAALLVPDMVSPETCQKTIVEAIAIPLSLSVEKRTVSPLMVQSDAFDEVAALRSEGGSRLVQMDECIDLPAVMDFDVPRPEPFAGASGWAASAHVYGEYGKRDRRQSSSPGHHV